MKNAKENWSVYIVECADGTLYTGISNDVEKRVNKHNARKGANYTKTRTPVKLVYQEFAGNKSQALKREYAIKQFSRKKKLKMIKN